MEKGEIGVEARYNFSISHAGDMGSSITGGINFFGSRSIGLLRRQHN